jgi:hypothetical protein
VRSALSQVPGVAAIETDVANRICRFRLNNDDLDIRAKLEELATTNQHIAGWSVME